MLKGYFRFFDEAKQGMLRDIGLLVMRLSFAGTMAAAHGWGKFLKVIKGDMTFGDPLGIGVGTSLVLAMSAEFFCSILVILGLLTRLSAIPLAFTMFVAAFIAHGDDPFSTKEKALLFLFAFVTLALTGPGRISLDELLRRKLG